MALFSAQHASCEGIVSKRIAADTAKLADLLARQF
jgi:hypothetical protein